MVNAVAGFFYMIITGDYPGYAIMGVEEDSVMVSAVLSARGMVVA